MNFLFSHKSLLSYVLTLFASVGTIGTFVS